MKTTAKLRNFARRVALRACRGYGEDENLAYTEFYKEYIAQIEEDDYSYLVSYAESEEMRIPEELRNVKS